MPNDCVRCRRLADNSFCTSDFAVMETDGAMACHEVKKPLAGRCTGQDQDSGGHVSVPLHCGEG